MPHSEKKYASQYGNPQTDAANAIPTPNHILDMTRLSLRLGDILPVATGRESINHLALALNNAQKLNGGFGSSIAPSDSMSKGSLALPRNAIPSSSG